MSSFGSNNEDFSVKLAKQLQSAKFVARLPYEIKFF